MRKYLHWGERREVPKAPMPTLTPERDPVVGKPFKEEEHRADNDAAREAREQSRRVMEKRQKGR